MERGQEKTMESSPVELSEIQYFYKNKTVFLIGATGFVGNLVLEKILRVLPVKHVYLLIRSKNNQDAETRCAALFDSLAYEPLKRVQPEFYKKVSLLQGDLEKANLGLNNFDLELIRNEVDYIFHCGSISNPDEDLKVATFTNVRATRDLLNVVKDMKHLGAFVFLSTAYSNFPRYEIHEEFYPPPIKAQELVSLCESGESSSSLKTRLLGEWPDTYTFTMSVAEDLLKQEGKGLPIGIIRPSLLLPSEKEPVTGYVDRSFGLVAHSVSHAMGVNRVNYYQNGTIDVIPVDYVVSLVLASGWFVGLQKIRAKRGEISNTEVSIYHCISSYEKPITSDEWMGITHTVFRDVPSSKMIQLPTSFNTACYYNYKLLIFVLHYLMGFLCDFALKMLGKKPVVVDMYNKLHKQQETFSPYLFKQFYFDNENTQKLLKRMTFKDRSLFDFDIFNLNWQTYLVSYAKGIRVYLLNDPMSTLAKGREKQHNKLVIQIISAGILAIILYFIAKMMMIKTFF